MRKRTGGCVRSYKVLQRCLFLRPFVVNDTEDDGVFALAIVAESMFTQHAFFYAADLCHGFLGPDILMGYPELHPAKPYLLE